MAEAALRTALKGQGRRLCRFAGEYRMLFRTTTRDNSKCASDYLCGLFQAEKRNLERMEEAVVDSDYEALQHFISESPWEHREVLARIGDEADGLLGGTPGTALLFDETSFVKKGRGSVGVGKQYSGRTRQVENCQVAVVAVLSAGDRAAPVDVRLFLPEDWTADAARCTRAGVPEEERRYRTKPQLVLEMVDRQVAHGRRFAWVGADGLYGHSVELRDGLQQRDLTYVLDVGCAEKVYLQDPQPRPNAPKGKGRKPTVPRAQTPATTLRKYAAALSDGDYQRVPLRPTSGAPLVVQFHCRRVWTWARGAKEGRQLWLLLRRDPDGKRHFALSNAPADTPAVRLAQMQSQRFWIERVFEDAKSEVGLAQYQVRGWRGWHHHVTMTFLAMLFMLRERMLHRDTVPLLSCRDIRECLCLFQARPRKTRADIVAKVAHRHDLRRAATNSKRRRRDGVGSDTSLTK